MPRFALISTLVATALLPLPAAAQDPASGPVRQHIAAHQLYDIGLAQDDALLILAAIALAHRVELRPASGWEVSGDGLPPPPPDAMAVQPAFPQDPRTSEALALVQLMAEESLALGDIAADVAAEIQTVTPGQPRLNAANRLLPEKGEDRWSMVFNGQLPAEIGLISETPLELRVQDAQGETLCAISAANAFCGFLPERNDFFTITIINSGPAAAYQIITN
ncbi:hypothetical protein Q9295_06270 [Xinfangfangia sp. CPCC 101601]|uniref:Uncharacterized protein n=1 Tax=Pseudogemmobacter lacusdianii TaxID=3069608 RepID=A0ABU0VW71_9RHOB|nr:hypothetical protein [Xinfangfangia sp. CPCC 101601]MDQ2065969.1 hypothetical protein [Xinfangfangia sp. CPCC 101601]